MINTLRRAWRTDSPWLLLPLGALLVGGVLSAFYVAVNWLAKMAMANPEFRAVIQHLTPWQWIAIAGVAVVAMKDFGASETKDVAKALNRIADAMEKRK